MSKVDLIGTRPRVLVVDDEAPLRELHAAFLAESYEVVEADRAERALELVRLGGIDVVLLDVMMPEMNGFDACRAIQAMPRGASVPVFLVTALDGVEARIEALDCGAEGLLAKPVDRRELTRWIERALEARDIEVALRRAALESERAHVHATEALSRILRDVRGAVAEVAGLSAAATAGAEPAESPVTEALDELGSALDELLEISSVSRDPTRETSGSLAALARAALHAAEQAVPGVPVRLVVDVDTPVPGPSGRVTRTISKLVARALASAHGAAAPVVVRVGRRDGAPVVGVSCSARPTPVTTRRRRARLSLDLVKLAAVALGATVQTTLDEGVTELVFAPGVAY